MKAVSSMYLWQEIRRGIPFCNTCEARTEREAKKILKSETVYRVREVGNEWANGSERLQH